VNARPLRSFDNYAAALMMWFQVLTLEGWGEICDTILDAYSPLSIIIFVMALLLGPFTTLKLFLATIALELQKMHEKDKWAGAQGILARWQNIFISDALDQWSYNVKLHMIKRTEACEVFVLSAIVRPMRECFIGWRDFTQCKDGTEDGRLAYLRRRNARKLRLALVSNALPMDAQLAFLMASHARLGRHSPAHVLRSDMRLWMKIMAEASALFKSALMQQLFDHDWNSDLYLTPTQVQWQRLAEMQSRCLTLATNPFEALEALAHSSAFNALVVTASVANIVRVCAVSAHACLPSPRFCTSVLYPFMFFGQLCVCMCVRACARAPACLRDNFVCSPCCLLLRTRCQIVDQYYQDSRV